MSDLFEASEEFEQDKKSPGIIAIQVTEFEFQDDFGLIPTGNVETFKVTIPTKQETRKRFDEVVQQIREITS